MTGTRLQGKIAIVTGGSRGIGAAIGEAFAAEGARVVLASRKDEELDRAASEIAARHPGAVRAKVCHVGRPAEVAELVAWVEREMGTPDVLVNNAGTNPYFGPLLDATEAAFDKTFEVNLKGALACTREVVRRLVARGMPGSIVNVASVMGLAAAPLQGVYGMTKAAMVSMTRTLAVELGRSGIRVNAIAPGLVDTRLSAALVTNPELRRAFTDRAPLGRHGEPAEIADLAVYLASGESSFVTGQTFCVDGGYSIA
ncbi:MAG: SDR family oxidoreductase [Planctomycetes bacterium]|nr:SDR family oxidoreductase [Planctomycetota bacterium]